MLEELFAGEMHPERVSAIHAYLVTNSALPGPRSNLELAYVFGDQVGDEAAESGDATWQLCKEMLAIPPEAAPVNTPREFLPVCGTIGIGALAAVLPERCKEALVLLRRAASDPRWRTREGVCMGLQRMLSVKPLQSLEALKEWVKAGNPFEMRAAAAAVAEPYLLRDDHFTLPALELQQAVLEQLGKLTERNSEGFRVLRKGLGYTLSVVVSAMPEEGFALMQSLASLPDRDIQWILRENLKKNRLVRKYPERVQAIKALL